MVDGAELGPEARKDGKVRLSALKPYQREWWISIDCFGVPETPKPPASMAKVAPDAAGAMGEIGEPEKIVEPEKDAPTMEPTPKY